MAQWVPQNSGTTNFLTSVYFIDATKGYAVGDSGIILKTTNGGENWVTQNSGTSHCLSSVFFLDSMTGYSVGNCGTILKTADGGLNWDLGLVDTNIILHSVDFPSESSGYIAGERTTYVGPFQVNFEAIVLKTIDYGVTWSENFITEGLLHSICFPSVERGYAGGGIPGTPGIPIFLKTIDGGDNWSVYNGVPGSGYVGDFISLSFINNDVGYGATGGSYVYKTIDGGENWTVITPGDRWSVYSICFIEEGIGYGVGYNTWGGAGTIYKTTDDGENWEIQDSTLSNSPYAIYFPNIDTGYIVGEGGMILKTTNGGGLPTRITMPSFYCSILKVYPNPAFTTITIELPNKTTPQQNTQLTIYNLNGQALLSRQITEPIINVDVSGLPQGVYFVSVINERTVMVGKFVKQ